MPINETAKEILGVEDALERHQIFETMVGFAQSAGRTDVADILVRNERGQKAEAVLPEDSIDEAVTQAVVHVLANLTNRKGDSPRIIYSERYDYSQVKDRKRVLERERAVLAAVGADKATNHGPTIRTNSHNVYSTLFTGEHEGAQVRAVRFKGSVELTFGKNLMNLSRSRRT